jgi:hypothetical protein
MRGHAFLTSSSEDEVAQESEALGGSFFTHYLISGLRGAADVSGEGKVTLNEAYQFAFHETLGGTANTRGGPQHPAYDIQLSGTGDVVMTDVRQTSAGLVLSEDLKGRCFVRNADDELVVELRKPEGRTVELGLAPGTYRINCDLKTGGMATSTEVAEGARVVVGPSQFTPTGVQETTARGTSGEPPGPKPLDGRNRIDLRWTISRQLDVSDRLNPQPDGFVRNSVEGFGGGIDYYRWFKEDLALALSASGRSVESNIYTGLRTENTTLSSFLVGVRWYPWSRPTSSVRFNFTGMAGPYVGTGSSVSVTPLFVTNKVLAVPGAYLGAGVDFRVGGRVMLGVSMGFDLMPDFSEPIGGTKNHSAFQMNLTFGWVWGKGHTHTN